MNHTSMKTGVYQIRNLKNGKLYIGSSSGRRGIKFRWQTHQSVLNRGLHHSPKLQHSWNKHGPESFVFEVLEECSPQDCLAREQFYLDTLLFAKEEDSRFEQLGYNVARNSSSKLGIKHTEATKQKMRKSHTRKLGEASNNAKLTEESVRQIKSMLKDGNSQRKVAERFAVTQATVFAISSGKTWTWLK